LQHLFYLTFANVGSTALMVMEQYYCSFQYQYGIGDHYKYKNLGGTMPFLGPPCPFWGHHALFGATMPFLGPPCPFWGHHALFVLSQGFQIVFE
jgi:hypothetical protein